MSPRHTVYSPEVADEICRRIADGEGLKRICRDKHMPAEATVRAWFVSNHEGFAAPYALAREAQMEKLAEEILEIADDTSGETIDHEGGIRRQNSEWANGRRLQVDSRKWLMSKLAPKRYGDKTSVELSGTIGFAQLVAEAGAKDEGE
jgi:hypothetical protein